MTNQSKQKSATFWTKTKHAHGTSLSLFFEFVKLWALAICSDHFKHWQLLAASTVSSTTLDLFPDL
jgi:hypothetical protein